MAKRGYRGKHPHNDMKVSKHSRSMNKTNPKLNSKLKETYLIMKGNQYKT